MKYRSSMKATGARIVARTPTFAMCFSTSYLLSKCGMPVCRLAEPTEVKTRCTPAALAASAAAIPCRISASVPPDGTVIAKRKPARGHQGVESKDVDNHRRQHCHRQRYVAVEQQKCTCDDLKREDHPQVMREIKGTHELCRNAPRRGKGNEVQEAVQPHNQKNQARQISGDYGSGSQIGRASCRERVESAVVA